MSYNLRFVAKKNNIIKVQFFGEKQSMFLNERLKDCDLAAYKSEWDSICWEFENIKREIEFSKGTVVQAMLSPDRKYIVLVYEKQSKQYPAPSNCVVYNLDGSIHKIITTPLLAIPDEKELKKGHSFETVGWTKNRDNKLVLYLNIAEEDINGWIIWYQEIEFDAASGEFGELLSRSGR